MRATYYLAFANTFLMGAGPTRTHAIEDAKRMADEAGVGIEPVRVVGPVHLYQYNWEVPSGATVAYRGTDLGRLPEDAHVAVLADGYADDTCDRNDCECAPDYCASNDGRGFVEGFDSTAEYMKSALGGGR
jgi:hypothetical protein